MKVCMIQSYSKNNEKLFNLTVGNHIKYCNKHNYSFLFNNQLYTPFLRLQNLRNICSYYDIIFTIGSDVLITNIQKDILDFVNIDKPINICKQGTGLSLVNGQIIFMKNCSELDQFIKIFDILQKENPNIQYGAQGLFCKFYLTNKELFLKYINLIQSGTLQKYLYTQENYNIRWNIYNNILNSKVFLYSQKQVKYPADLVWKNCNDFCLHTIGLNNKEKYDVILNVIKDHQYLIKL